MAERILAVHNVTRGRANRTQRKLYPGRRRFTQRLAGGEVVVRRARPVLVNESWVEANLGELKNKVEEGAIELKTQGGEPVDINTLKAIAPVATPPAAHPPPDTIDRDKKGPTKVLSDDPNLPPVTAALPKPTLAQEGLPEGKEPLSDERVPKDPAERRKSKKSKK